MENSGKIMGLGGEDVPQWYVALGERWIGPLSASEIFEKIQANQITWAHFVWKKGQPDWRRICELKAFQAAVPNPPAREFQREIQKEVKETVEKNSEPEIRPVAGKRAPVTSEQKSAKGGIVPEARIWYLHYNDSHYGPFSQEEVSRFIKVGKIHLRVFAWKEGMKTWERLGQIPAFSSQKGPDPVTPKKTEQRNHPRRPLVAKILMSDDKTVLVGVCRDLSIGGLQVLTERLPGEVGTRLKMNISPSSNETGAKIEPFVAEGVVVRILEDGRGFSFRFERLSERAIRSIEAYFESPQ